VFIPAGLAPHSCLLFLINAFCVACRLDFFRPRALVVVNEVGIIGSILRAYCIKKCWTKEGCRGVSFDLREQKEIFCVWS